MAYAIAKGRFAEIKKFFEAKKLDVGALLPEGLSPKRFIQIAYTCVINNPKLLDCTKASLALAVFQAAKLGLEPDMNGQCYIIPYGKIATFQTGYKGLKELMYRSPQIATVEARSVFEKDAFEYEYGLNARLKHKPCEDEDKGALAYAYAIVVFKSGHKVFNVMTGPEVLAIKARSKAAQKGSSPWQTDEPMMWQKTALIRISKIVPSSPKLRQAMAIEDAFEGGKSGAVGIEGEEMFIDAEITDTPTKTESVKNKLKNGGKKEPAPKASPPAAEEESMLPPIADTPSKKIIEAIKAACDGVCLSSVLDATCRELYGEYFADVEEEKLKGLAGNPDEIVEAYKAKAAQRSGVREKNNALF